MIYDVLNNIVPTFYGRYPSDEENQPPEPPFICYMGAGQETFDADNTFYYSQNEYTAEYYFLRKNEETEAALEASLLANGYKYTKSDDIYIESEDMYYIVYDIS